jgi:uncharacterized membrane protein
MPANQPASGNHSNQTSTTQIRRVTFQGPLPPPEILAQYNQITPGFADRIISLTEAEQKHRHQVEATVVGQTFEEQKRGQVFGLIIGIVAIVAGTIAAIAGSTVAGSIIGGGGVIGLVSVFVLGRVLDRNDDTEK